MNTFLIIFGAAVALIIALGFYMTRRTAPDQGETGGPSAAPPPDDPNGRDDTELTP